MADAPEAVSFRIDFGNLCLWRPGTDGREERLDLPPKTFDVLRYLVEHAGRLVTHDELLTALWRDVHVQPEVLKSHVLAIRNALGDKSSNPRFIETQRGRGYRYIGAMDGLAPAENKPDAVLDLGAFAGRAEPAHELQAALQRAASGAPQAVFVSGEPGIGKTTLIEQFLGQVRKRPDIVVAEGYCIEGFAGAEPYYPLLEALRGLCAGADGARVVRALLDLAPSWATQMPAQISAGQRAALRQQILPGARSRMVREGCGLFEALAAERPLVLVLEDLHWADFATIDFMSAFCRRRSSARMLLIGSYRPEDLKTARHPLQQMTRDLALRKYCRQIELAPLSADAIAGLLTDRADGAAAAPAFADFITERTGGNPLFIRVTLEYLLQCGDVAHTAHGWQPLVPLDRLASETPPTLSRAIETKIEGMTDEQRRALEAASVAGDHFDPVTTAPAAGMDVQSFESLCETLSAYTIRPDKLLTLPNNQRVRTYTFNHAAYRQVLYGRIGEVRRASLHRAIGERLEEIYPPDLRGDLAVRLAHHFAFARDWARALNYLRAALQVANTRSARRDAATILDRAVELAANLPEPARLSAEIEFLEWRAALETAAHAPRAHETYALLAEKAGQCGDIDTQCRALVGLSYTISWLDVGRSLGVLDEVLALCERQSDPIQRDLTRVTAYARRVWGYRWSRSDRDACEEALVRLQRHGDPSTIAWAQANFSMVCMLSTRYQEAHDFVDDSYRVLCRAAQNLGEADSARVTWIRHVGLPWSLYSLGNFGAALAEYDAGIAILEKNDDATAVQSLRIYRSVLLFHAMDFEGVLAVCAPVADAPTEHMDNGARVLPAERRLALVYGGLAAAGLGNGGAALKLLRQAEAEMARLTVHMDWYWRLALNWGVVNVQIAEGDRAAARAGAEQLCILAAQTDDRAWQALGWEARARAALSRGDAAEAADSLANALAACSDVTAPLAEWRVHATGAMICDAVGDADRARAHDRLGSAIRRRLADTLPAGSPLRLKFESRSISPWPRPVGNEASVG
jgi:tetratricopeptide (TPR) repeat protein